MILMASVVFGKAAGLVFKIALANMLGGVGMGYFSSAYAVYTPLYAIFSASLTPAVAQLVSESEARNDVSRLKSVKSAALRLFLLPSILISLLPMAFAGFLTEHVIGSPGAKPAVIAILPCVFLGTVTAIYRGYYEGLRNMTPTALSQMTESAVRVAAGVGLAYLTQRRALNGFISGGSGTMSDMYERSLPWVAAAAVLGVTLSEVSSFLFMLIRHKLLSDGTDRAVKPRVYEINASEKRLIALILPISAAGMVMSLSGTVDLYTIISGIKASLFAHPEMYRERYAEIIKSGVALKELPNYLYGSFTGLASTVFGLAPSLCFVFGKSALPSVSKAWAEGDLTRVRREIRRVISLTLYLSIPAGLGLSALSKEILSLLFSSRMPEVSISYLPLSVMALGTAFVTVTGAGCSMLQAVGRADLPIAVNLAGAFVKLALNLVLVPIPSLGLCGAAAASLISGAVMCLVTVVSLYRMTGTRPRLLSSTLTPLAGGVLASAGGLWIMNTARLYISHTLSVIFSVTFAVISYIFFILLLDISTKFRFKDEILGK